MKKKPFRRTVPILVLAATIYFWLNSYQSAYAMHIAEGFLPLKWVIIWWAIYLPFLFAGMKKIHKLVADAPEVKMMLGLSGAFVFVLSALKLPSVTGSSSHPTGTGLGTALFGPIVMSVLGFIVLLFQALLLAHGGLTTLGANGFSMAVAGPFVAYWIIQLGKRLGLSFRVSLFTGALLGDLATYSVTSFQLALAFPAATGGVAASFLKFSSIFLITQLPLAISEAILTVIVMNLLFKYNTQVLKRLKIPFREEVNL